MMVTITTTLPSTSEPAQASKFLVAPGSVKIRERNQHMPSAATNDPPEHSPGSAKWLYHTLYHTLYRALLKGTEESSPVPTADASAQCFLTELLAKLSRQTTPLPNAISGLDAWLFDHQRQVATEYQAYLLSRQQGASRRLFSSLDHARDFLDKVAPTKLVDGAWLYGTLQHWQDERFHPLITTYLEELGSGVPNLNHVRVFKGLLNTESCNPNRELDDSYYLQGAIQLSLARHTQTFLPELLGYNLGYEQPPLHLLISCVELRELGINPKYFRLHVTIDNAASGHARQALAAVQAFQPGGSEENSFYQRVQQGFQLAQAGPDTEAVLASYDIRQRVVAILQSKAVFARGMHSNRARIAGRTVNEWLETGQDISNFLHALESSGWIRRHQDPQRSRFWRLIDGPEAEMFGVFTAAEQQCIYEWISGDWLPAKQAMTLLNRRTLRSAPLPSEEEQPILLDIECEELQRHIAKCSLSDAAARLIDCMAPGRHSLPAGMLATQLFEQQIMRS